MNIVLIHAHDLGRFCEPYGYSIPSPNLQRFAEKGVLFRNCHCSAPSCAPSRAAMLTGTYPHVNGMMGLPSAHLGYRINDYSRHLSAFLKRNGYETALSGVQHEAHLPFADPKELLAYDHFLNFTSTAQQEHDPARTASAAIEFLSRDHDKPFFLSVGFLDPHRDNRDDSRVFIESYPMTEPADIDTRARYCRPWPHMPDHPIMRREMANFRMGVASLDAQVGMVLNALEAPALRDDTLVIFTTDHGPGVAEMKCTLSDRGTGVALMIRGPGGEECGQAGLFSGGQVIDGLVQHLDLYPTICQLAGLDAPEWLQGRSLVPLMAGESERVHEAIFTEQTYHWSAEPRPLRAVRTDRYKYIKSYDASQPWGVDRGPTQILLEELGYGKQPMPGEQLYDLAFDPNEANNLADRPGNEQALDDMRSLLGEWQEATDDPIRNGEIPVPPAKA